MSGSRLTQSHLWFGLCSEGLKVLAKEQPIELQVLLKRDFFSSELIVLSTGLLALSKVFSLEIISYNSTYWVCSLSP